MINNEDQKKLDILMDKLSKITVEESIHAFIVSAAQIYQDTKSKSLLNWSIRTFGSKHVWTVVGDKLRAAGLSESDLEENDVEFLIENFKE